MTKILRFVIEIPIENVSIGEFEGVSLDDVSVKIRQAVKTISESNELRDEYAKCFREELGAHIDLYVNALRAIGDGINNAQIIEIEEE